MQQTVVLGGGMGGIAAAAALRTPSREVVIVERDRLPPRPALRRGVPQGHQLHNLLTCALVHLEDLLPGFGAALRRVGCGTARVAEQTHVFELGTRMPERDLGLQLVCAPRPVIEEVARSLLLAGGGVSIREGASAVGLTVAPDGYVSGAVVEDEGHRQVLPAELVVDATGAASPADRWLAGLGQPVPAADVLRHDQWYTSVVVRRPDRWVGDPAFWLTFPTPPSSRSGLVSPVDDHHWSVSMSGRSQDPPCRSFEDMVAHARTLEDPAIADLLSTARPHGRPRLFRRPTATWRRYDALPEPLPGFVPLGDAIAVLNPIFGQGISVAARQAVQLRTLLRGWDGAKAALPALTQAYLTEAAETCQAAWSLDWLVEAMVTADGGGDDRQGRTAALARLLAEDVRLHRLYVGNWHLVEPRTAVVRPTVASRLDLLVAGLTGERV